MGLALTLTKPPGSSWSAELESEQAGGESGCASEELARERRACRKVVRLCGKGCAAAGRSPELCSLAPACPPRSLNSVRKRQAAWGGGRRHGVAASGMVPGKALGRQRGTAEGVLLRCGLQAPRHVHALSEAPCALPRPSGRLTGRRRRRARAWGGP